jgi:hypothetical protein
MLMLLLALSLSLSLLGFAAACFIYALWFRLVVGLLPDAAACCLLLLLSESIRFVAGCARREEVPQLGAVARVRRPARLPPHRRHPRRLLPAGTQRAGE